MPQSSINTKTILIVLLLVVSLGVMILAGNRIYNLLAKAGGSAAENVQVSQVTTNTVTISFSTADPSSSLIEYGTNPTSLTLFANDTDATNHQIILSLLTPNTTYYFHIKIGENVYDNNGVPWSFTTASNNSLLPTLTLAPTLGTTSGSGGRSGPVTCSDVATRMGTRRGSSNYDVKYDLNGDGIINSLDMSLCGK